jgi:nicotinate-nucleotide adenylyltransferase
MSSAGAVGIVGGTFDPIHEGHLAMARQAAEQLGLEQVLLMPAGAPWQRVPQASARDRLAMAQIAVGNSPNIRVDDREVRRSTPTYTIDTLHELRSELGTQRPIWLVLGADAFLNIPTWRRWQELLLHAHIAVACRPGYALQDNAMAPSLKRELAQRLCNPAQACGAAGAIVMLDIPPLDISSTEIRAAIRQQRAPGRLLPRAVLDYIESHHLYR